jgi:predicted lipoprotein with Yx(FWY)xxD motif
MTWLKRSAVLVLALAAVTLVVASAGFIGMADFNLTARVASTPTAKAPVKTATATVSGKSETILTASNGMTLYYRTTDTPPSNVCSGACAQIWHPLLFKGTPPAVAGLPGKLTTQTTANGSQVEYNGRPLYTYAGDSAPGQTNGEGKGGVWHVATPASHRAPM